MSVDLWLKQRERLAPIYEERRRQDEERRRKLEEEERKREERRMRHTEAYHDFCEFFKKEFPAVDDRVYIDRLFIALGRSDGIHCMYGAMEHKKKGDFVKGRPKPIKVPNGPPKIKYPDYKVKTVRKIEHDYRALLDHVYPAMMLYGFIGLAMAFLHTSFGWSFFGAWRAGVLVVASALIIGIVKYVHELSPQQSSEQGSSPEEIEEAEKQQKLLEEADKQWKKVKDNLDRKIYYYHEWAHVGILY
ncbi:MAG: hypothetical protein D6698_05610 [Gammaproteobacteria bacterium]|nr:MAG: hypothetical protein D6698_05610 [Gammaproteobacteria bacterium]